VIFFQHAVFGVGIGAVLALLAAGIIVVYRASGVLNFAHASMGTLGAYVNFWLIESAGLPVVFALAVSVVVGAVIGVAAHRLVFVHVAEASQVVKLIVSFGLAGVLQGVIALIWSTNPPGTHRAALLSPEDGITVGGAVIPHQRLAVIVVSLLAAVGIALLVRLTSFGVQLRALAQNSVAARLAGVDDRRIQTSAWAIGGATAALAAVLVLPPTPLNPLALSGYQVTALAAALVGGFVSLPAALAGGLGLGVAQEVLIGAPAPLNGLRSVLATVVILVLLFIHVERFFVSDQEARAVEGDERLFLRGVRVPVLGRPSAWLAGSAAAAAGTLLMSGFWAFVTTRAALYALLALSLVVLTGWSGQVSLMPGTFAGVGACLAWVLDTRLGFPLPLTVPLAGLATIPVCAVVGVIALRLRPLYLAVATLGLASLFDDTLFRQEWIANAGAQMRVARPGLVAGDHAFAAAVLLIIGALFAFTAAFAGDRVGRAFRMVRDNPRAAESSGVNPVKYRLLAFALSAFYAGVAGALLAYLLGAFTTAEFSFSILSLTAFGLAAVGGMRSPLGAVVGAFAFVQLTEFFRSSGAVNDWTSVIVGAGIIAVMAWSPDGLVGLGQRAVAAARRSRVPADEGDLLLEDAVAHA
jgi:branched-subunit amino acid ABC-type transport system permease component